MDPVSAMLFALAVTWYGSRTGAVRAVRSVRDNHRTRKASRPEPRPAPAGIRAGHVVSAGVTGSVLAVRDFGTGWRAGWVDGRDKARTRRDAKRDGQRSLIDRMFNRMSPADRDTWGEARTLADMGERTAQWLEGDLTSQPGYAAGYGPAGETTDLIPVLADANRRGYVTHGSQPGVTEEYGRQRAGVSGWADPETARRIRETCEAEGLVVIDVPPGEGAESMVVSQDKQDDGEWGDFTDFGPMPGGYFHDWWGRVCHRDAMAAVDGAHDVTVIDPEWGRNDVLWPALSRAVDPDTAATEPGPGWGVGSGGLIPPPPEPQADWVAARRDIRRDQHDARNLTITPEPTETPTETEPQTAEEGVMIRALDSGEEYFTRLERATIRANRCPALAPEGYCGNPVDPRFVFCDAHVLRDEAWGHHSTTAMRREEIAAQLAETEATDPPAPPEPPADGRPAPVSLTKETTVMPHTQVFSAAATAEVQSLPELIGFLEQIENDAQAELEDAQARETRAKKLASDIETVLGQLATFELGNTDLNVVGGLLDPTASAEKAATIAVEAAEHIHAMAQNAASVLLKRHQQMQEAADATPEPASMDFYKNGQNS